MSKGLEALNDLVNHINEVAWQEVFEPLVNKNKNIIEKELKALEIIKNKIAFDEGWEIFLTEEEKETLKEVGL